MIVRIRGHQPIWLTFNYVSNTKIAAYIKETNYLHDIFHIQIFNLIFPSDTDVIIVLVYYILSP